MASRGGRAAGAGAKGLNRAGQGRESKQHHGQTGRARRMPRNASPRRVAYEVTARISATGSFANLILPKAAATAGLDGQGAAFATELVYGTQRWRGLLDAIIAAAARRRTDDMDAELLDLLRLGAFQLLFMDVPAHAAVSETVEMAGKLFGRARSGFVNAVLRRVAERSRKDWEAMVVSRIPKTDGIGRLATRWSHPAWIVRELADAWTAAGYAGTGGAGAADDAGAARDGGAAGSGGISGPSGDDGAADADSGSTAADPAVATDPVVAMLERDNAAPDVTLVARPGLIGRDELAASLPSGAEARPGALSPYALRVHGVNPERLAAVREGKAGVEDEGSQMAALALAEAPLTGRDQRWLDMCAGPGGKTALLAAIAAGRGARIVANEPSHHRADLVRDNLRAMPADAVEAVIERDGRALLGGGSDGSAAGDGSTGADGAGGAGNGVLEAGSFDRVLVDAPCSGLGSLRRRPEARWNKTPGALEELAGVQADLLRAALGLVRPGGVVAYVTCSPALAETRAIVRQVLAGLADTVEPLDTAAVLRGIAPGMVLPASSSDGADGAADAADVVSPVRAVQLFEHLHDTDQMFIALLRRVA